MQANKIASLESLPIPAMADETEVLEVLATAEAEISDEAPEPEKAESLLISPEPLSPEAEEAEKAANLQMVAFIK